MTLAALYGVLDQAKAARTRTQITKLHSMIMLKWEGYRVRQVPLRIPSRMRARPERFADTNGNCWRDPTETSSNNIYPINFDGTTTGDLHDYGGAYIRLLAMRELMRMELPDRISDLEDGPRVMVYVVQGGSSSNTLRLQLTAPSIWKAYRRKANTFIKAKHGAAGDWRNRNHWTIPHQGAECLYLIISSIRDGDTSGLDFFKESEVGDTDEDGMPEILDGWGRPIEFLRWAPGFATGEGPDGGWGVVGVDDDGVNGIDDPGEVGWPGSDDGSELQPRDPANAPDPFDPLKVHLSPAPGNNVNYTAKFNYALFPLIYSAGFDSIYDINTGGNLRYAATAPWNNPYVVLSGNAQVGRPIDAGGDGEIGSFDNITNHLLDSR